MTLQRLFNLLIPACLAACTAAPSEGAGSSDSAISGHLEPGSTVTTTSRLNLREGPSLDDDIILTMPSGASVTLLGGDPENGFYEVRYGDDQGWAYGAYLSGTGQHPTSSSDTDDDSPSNPAGPSGSPSGRTFSGVTMLWQGDWDYLVECDSYSRSRGRVVFYCSENTSRSFVDDGAWIAVPGSMMTTSLCNQNAQVCKGSRCIVARIIEKSETSSKWEGSRAVLEALGVDVGYSSCNRSYGTATGVSVTLAAQ